MRRASLGFLASAAIATSAAISSADDRPVRDDERCTVEVTTDDPSATMRLDDGRELSACYKWTFTVSGGSHVISGNFKNTAFRFPIECTEGKRFPITLTVARPDAPTNLTVSAAPPTNRITWGIAPAVLWGTNPTAAYGIAAASTFYLRNLPITIAARAAYSSRPLSNAPLDLFAFQAIASPCLEFEWLHICGSASLNIIKSRPIAPATFDTIGQIVPGFGVAGTVRYAAGKNFNIFATFDGLALTERASLSVRKPNAPERLWTGGSFLYSLSLGLEFFR